jgi:adenine-specific DNA-methyltransferase
MAKKPQPPAAKQIETLVHDEASRKNIPTAEFQSVMRPEDQRPIRVAYKRRDADLDPQLIWRGKYPDDDIDAIDRFTVPAPPLYIQEKVHPKVLIDDLKRETEKDRAGRAQEAEQIDLFADFNGLPNTDAKTEFYQHDQNWSNRMILGDSLQVMASLAEREGLRGKVNCIYFDPPYGIKFNSNFQWSTTNRDVKDGNVDHITREPEQVKAFRDTWRDGIHSYLSYIRDRLILARDLLHPSGSIFVQMGEENLHRVRAVLDEIFGEDNACSTITFVKTTGFSSSTLPNITDYLIWYAKEKTAVKFRPPFFEKKFGGDGSGEYTMIRSADGTQRSLTKAEKRGQEQLCEDDRIFRLDNLRSQGASTEGSNSYLYEGTAYPCGSNMHWKTNTTGLNLLSRAQRLSGRGEGKTLCYVRFIDDFPAYPISNVWTDAASGDNQVLQKVYVVQTLPKVIERCLLMTTDPGDLVVDPTCGSGTTAYVAEQWGRRWITIDTSRVALALARAREMGARYSYYLLADSREGKVQEAKLQGRVPSDTRARGDVRQGFVYERVRHITLKSIANNSEIDIIWEEYQRTLEPLREKLNIELRQNWQEWEIPRAAPNTWSEAILANHAAWWKARIARQKAIDASIAAKAEFENLYDKPYEDKSKVRVAGPFTVESLSPYRALEMMDDNLAPSAHDSYDDPRDAGNFVQVILDNLKISGVQQADKNAKISFSSLTPWPGDLVCAEGRYEDADGQVRRAAILIGPEFGTVSRPDLVSAAREAGDANFDVLIACAFNFDAQSSEFSKLGRIPVLKARMNADLHMAEDLKNTGKGNLFVIFGEPDIEIIKEPNGDLRVKMKGVDVFHPATGEVTSSEPDEIACWFVDTDYNEESFFVRHAYFLGANDPYKSLKTTLKAEINEEAWQSLHSDTSRAFPKPASGRIAVKVINHLGDEVMKVFSVR